MAPCHDSGIVATHESNDWGISVEGGDATVPVSASAPAASVAAAAAAGPAAGLTFAYEASTGGSAAAGSDETGVVQPTTASLEELMAQMAALRN